MLWNLPAEAPAKPEVWCCPPLLLWRDLHRQCSCFLHPLLSFLPCPSLSHSGLDFLWSHQFFLCLLFVPGVEALSENTRDTIGQYFFLTMSPLGSHHKYILEYCFHHPKWYSMCVNSHCASLPTLSSYLPFLRTPLSITCSLCLLKHKTVQHMICAWFLSMFSRFMHVVR